MTDNLKNDKMREMTIERLRKLDFLLVFSYQVGYYWTTTNKTKGVVNLLLISFIFWQSFLT